MSTWCPSRYRTENVLGTAGAYCEVSSDVKRFAFSRIPKMHPWRGRARAGFGLAAAPMDRGGCQTLHSSTFMSDMQGGQSSSGSIFQKSDLDEE